jgi:uncharacterized protein YbcI
MKDRRAGNMRELTANEFVSKAATQIETLAKKALGERNGSTGIEQQLIELVQNLQREHPELLKAIQSKLVSPEQGVTGAFIGLFHGALPGVEFHYDTTGKVKTLHIARNQLIASSQQTREEEIDIVTGAIVKSNYVLGEHRPLERHLFSSGKSN